MRMVSYACLLAAFGFASPALLAQQKDKPKEVWTDPADPTLPIDFKIQGEYAATNVGLQVIALGNGMFQAVVLPGGLPGAGWDGKNKSLLDGKLEGETAKFAAAKQPDPAKDPKGKEIKRSYLAGKAELFSATSKFPPEGHQAAYTGTANGTVITLAGVGGAVELKKVERKSPTLGAKAPDGALVLFDGSNKDEWTAGRVDATTKFLNTDGKDLNTKKKFNNYTMHIEFMLPYRPDARGQGRGNSGFYQVLMYEVQVLDSFGLEGKNNECGGVYQKADAKVNMCLPPLVWQTYDAEFTNAVSEGGKVVKNSRLTLKHNGGVVQDDLEIKGKTGGARNEPEGTPGPIQLQGHGNPLQYRNIWIVEKK